MKAGNLFKAHKPNAKTDARIIEVADNPQKYSWKPNMCMLQHNHSRYNKSECLPAGAVDMDPDAQENKETSFVTQKTFAATMQALGLGEKEKKPLVKNPLSGTK